MGAYSFDFAKTITTGEGGMLSFKNKKDYEKASAWHDHGHQNNPNVPRWEDTRTGRGFNYRMSELQGAVGIAQLKKLKKIVKYQNINRNKIWDRLKKYKELKIRSAPLGSYETADALIFFVNDKKTALKCRSELMKVNIPTKILPEAMTWHFAGEWEHIKEIDRSSIENYRQSKEILYKAVSLPININMKEDAPEKIEGAIKKAIRDN